MERSWCLEDLAFLPLELDLYKEVQRSVAYEGVLTVVVKIPTLVVYYKLSEILEGKAKK